MIDLKKILVPTDFSLPSQRALRYAIELSKQFGSEVLMLHVVERPTLAPSFRSPGTAVQDLDAEVRAWAEGELGKMIQQEVPAGVKVRTLIRGGSPFKEIIMIAKDQDMDLIVMGTSGHGVLERMLMGSVADKVVRKAPCAVLTVRNREKDFVVPWGEGGGPSM